MSTIFNKPFIINDPSEFVAKTEEYFNEYAVFAESTIDSLSLNDEDKEFYKLETNENIQQIFQSLVSYQNGHKLDCYDKFQSLMLKNLRYLKNILNNPKSQKKSNNVFYRIRRGDIPESEKIAFPNHTLFHLPFSLRHNVGTGRFNSAGIPILYLSDCLKIPYNECSFPKTSFCDHKDEYNSLNIGFFRNAKPFQFFDFSIVPWEQLMREYKDATSISKLINYIVLFPIIAAIHLKINFSRDVSFHFDYVFSSLIMDFVKNLEIDNLFNNTGLLLPIFAVKYSSVKLFLQETNLKEDSECYKFHNYAFLTKYYPNSNHCLSLESIFLNNSVNKAIYADNINLKKYKNKKLSDQDLSDIEKSFLN